MTPGIMPRVALWFLVVGTLMLSFVAYQLWGTALYEHHAQNQLRQEIVGALDRPHGSSAASKPGNAANATGNGSADNPTIGATTPTTSAAQAAAAAQAPPTGDPIGLMSIPRIGMSDEAVVEGVGEAQLQEGPGHYPGTPLPGQAGNVAIAGHRTTYGAPFYNLDQLEVGDPIFIQVPEGRFQYDVMRTSVVSPTDTDVLDTSPLPILTLTTCNPRYSASTRLIVVALLAGSVANPTTSLDPSPGSSTSAPPNTSTSAPSRSAGNSSADTLRASDEQLAGSNSSGGSIPEAVLWGELTLIVFFVIRVLWRLVRNRVRWCVLPVGTLAVVTCLFVFFEHVSLALPASF